MVLLLSILPKHGHKENFFSTKRFGKVRRLLRDNQAIVKKRCPFTIQLLYEADNHVQPVVLGIDAGSKHVGVSATTKEEELYAGELELRDDIPKLLASRREFRRTRRNRKTRYRKARFSNRIRSKHKGWLAPSIEHKIHCHIQLIDDICSILPIEEIIIETASFDIQKIKNPDITGKEYQEGEQLGFWNTREYVLFRDNHQCQCCKGRSKDKVLEVHHIESRKTGGDAPNNLITLCKSCHDGYHNGTVVLPKSIQRGKPFRDAVFMGIMRWTLYDCLKEKYPNVKMTYGYITKHTRISNHLQKTHYIDARCITGHPNAKPLGIYYYQKKVRCHNRQIHKATILKGGIRKRNQASFQVFGFQLFDKVLFHNTECFIFGRRSTGYFDLRLLDGTKIHNSASYKKLQLLEHNTGLLTERRLQGEQFLPTL